MRNEDNGPSVMFCDLELISNVGEQASSRLIGVVLRPRFEAIDVGIMTPCEDPHISDDTGKYFPWPENSGLRVTIRNIAIAVMPIDTAARCTTAPSISFRRGLCIIDGVISWRLGPSLWRFLRPRSCRGHQRGRGRR